MPYYNNLSERVSRFFKSYGIVISFKFQNNLASCFTNHKLQYDKSKSSGVMYRIPYGNCNSVYNGLSGRSFETRVNETAPDYRNGTSNSKLV